MNRRVQAILQSSKEYIPNVAGICLNANTGYCYIVSNNEYYNNKLIVSYNGIDWETLTIESLDNNIIYHWNSICWSPDLSSNYLCAVGNNGYVITSTNGINWTLKQIGNGEHNYLLVYWSLTEKKYYALNLDVKIKAISDDGITWIESSLTDDEYNNLSKLHFSSSWNVYTAFDENVIDKISYEGTGNTLDNELWFEDIQGPFAVVNNELGAPATDYIILNYDESSKTFTVMYPTDNSRGINAAITQASSITSFQIVYSLSDLKLVGAVYSPITENVYAIDNANKCWYTNTLYEWRQLSSVGLSDIVTDMQYVESINTIFVLASNGDNTTSSNGVSWNRGTAISGGETNLIPKWNYLCWSPTISQMIAVSSDEYPYIAKSYDGRNWELEPFDSGFSSYEISSVIWSSVLEKYVAVTANDNKIIASSDGSNWTVLAEINMPFNQINSITESTLLGQLIISTANRLALFKSSDGITWQPLGLPDMDDWYNALYITSKGFLSVFGYEKIIYSADLINWEVTSHRYTFNNPLKVIEIPVMNKCIVIDVNTYTTYTMTLGLSAEAGATLDRRPKWIKAQYQLNDNINLIPNPNFADNNDNWYPVLPNQADKLDTYARYDSRTNTTYLECRIQTPTGTVSENIGIETDWINVTPNTNYCCNVEIISSNQNCYMYIYGLNDDGTESVIRVSNNASVANYIDLKTEFTSRNYQKLKVAIKITQGYFNDYFMFSKVRLYPKTATVFDNSLFNHDGNVNDYDIEYDCILGQSAIKLYGTDDSYLSIEQPFVDNDIITIALWVRFDNLSFDGNNAILYSGTDESNLKLYVNRESSHLIVELLQEKYDVDYVLIQSEWYHIAVVYNLNRLSVYINGERISSFEKIISDFETITYNDTSIYTRFGALTPKNDDDYIISQWDGKTVTTTWYTNNLTNTFTINSASDLVGLARIVNTGVFDFAECIVSLQTNVNLGNFDWTPIGTLNSNISRPFKGIFNGNNHDIRGLKVELTSDTYSENGISGAGLFGYVSGNNTEQSCIITSVKVYGNIKSELNYHDYGDDRKDFYNTAGIIAYGEKYEISDCEYSGTLDGIGTIGGIVSYSNTGQIYNSTNNAPIYATNANAGGIVGYAIDTHVINCNNNENIELNTNEANCAVGGIIGFYYTSETTIDRYYEISNSINNANILCSTIDNELLDVPVGGIVGRIQNGSMELRVQGSQNYGIIRGISDVGGIVGLFESNANNATAVYEALNNGEIYDAAEFAGLMSDLLPSNYRNVAGIVARIGINCTQTIAFHGIINNGHAHTGENVGGIIGINSNRINIYNCYNNGKISDGYNAAGILGNMNGFCSINNCSNTGFVSTLVSQAPTYIGAMIAKTQTVGSIQDSSNNVYLNTSLQYTANIFDSLFNAESKTHRDMIADTILNTLNGGFNETQQFKYILDYNDEIVTFLALAGKFAIPEELLTLLNNAIDNRVTTSSEYVPLACTLSNIYFFDFEISHKIIRELSHGKILHYKCSNKEETNINFIPVEDGTFSELISKEGNDPGTKPIIEKIDETSNIFGSKTWSVTFPANAKASSIQLMDRVETENFQIDSTVSDYSFSIYIKNNVNNFNKLRFMFIVNDNTEQYFTFDPNITTETFGSNALSGMYTRYAVSLNQLFSAGATVRLVIGLEPGSALGHDPNILDNEFTVYFVAPQLENKAHYSDYIEGRTVGTLHDISGFGKNTSLPIATCPIYDDTENCYIFNPGKKIEIPGKYANYSKQFTVSFWYKIPSTVGRETNVLIPKNIVSRSNSFFSPGKGWLIGVSSAYNNDIVFETRNESMAKDVRFNITTQTVYSWTLLTAVYDNGNMYTYVNGRPSSLNVEEFTMDKYTFDSANHDATNIIIGSNFTDTSGVNSMQGDMIRDFRIYNTALSDNDVLEIYQASGIVDTLGLLHGYAFRTINENNPNYAVSKKCLVAKNWHISDLVDNIVHFWPMWGTSKNYSDNNDNILYVNDIEVTKGVKNLRCFRFNGQSSYANTKSSIEFSDIPTSTITFWIKIDEADASNACLIELSENAFSNNAFSIYLNSDGKIVYSDYGVTTDSIPSVITNNSINDNRWHYIVIEIIRCRSVAIYIDNVKDIEMSNYASLVTDSSFSAPEELWYNEYVYNTPINNVFFYDNNVFLNRMSEKNSFKYYPTNGDNTNSGTIDSILPHSQSAYINKMIYSDNIIYITLHDYMYGISYLVAIDTRTGIKTVLTTSFYISELKVKNNKVYVTDKNYNISSNNTYNRYVCNINSNNGITLNHDSYWIQNINRIYDDAGTEYNEYLLNDTEIVWYSDNAPNGEYYIDFIYTAIDYTTYYVKSIDINNNAQITIYDAAHTAPITSICIDNEENVYTSSYDCTVKKTSADGIVWTWSTSSIINDIEFSPNNQTLLVALKDKTLVKLYLTGEEVLTYYPTDDRAITQITTYNGSIYCLLTNDVYTSDFETNRILLPSSNNSAIIKMDDDINVIWTQELDSPASTIEFMPDTNNMYVAGTDGRLLRINEIVVIPYENYLMYFGGHAGESAFFKGLLQDVKIYNKILSSAEKNIQYNLYDNRINRPVQIDSDNNVYVYQDIYEMF